MARKGGGACFTQAGVPKLRYDTRAEAKEAMRRFSALPGAEPNQPYRCPRCGYFHLGRYTDNPDARAALRARHRKGDVSGPPPASEDEDRSGSPSGDTPPPRSTP